MADKKFKIVKAFYCFHPEIIINDKVRPAFWGLEWTVWVKNNPQPTIGIHYQRNLETEEQAQGLLTELQEIVGEFAPWHEFDYTAWYLSPQYRKCVLGQKKRVISPVPRYE